MQTVSQGPRPTHELDRFREAQAQAKFEGPTTTTESKVDVKPEMDVDTRPIIPTQSLEKILHEATASSSRSIVQRQRVKKEIQSTGRRRSSRAAATVAAASHQTDSNGISERYLYAAADVSAAMNDTEEDQDVLVKAVKQGRKRKGKTAPEVKVEEGVAIGSTGPSGNGIGSGNGSGGIVPRNVRVKLEVDSRTEPLSEETARDAAASILMNEFKATEQGLPGPSGSGKEKGKGKGKAKVKEETAPRRPGLWRKKYVHPQSAVPPYLL